MAKIFDNNGQYTDNGIARYEVIFGKAFISTGGLESTVEVIKYIEKLTPETRILDVGCGMGGSAFYFHDTYGASVFGVDLATKMIEKGQGYIGDRKNVKLIVSDIFETPLEDNYYDLVYSRDAIIHIKEKKKLFDIMYRVLKPGGQVVITDYSFRHDSENLGEEFLAYYKSTGYFLESIPNYGNILKSAGFEVQAIDFSETFLKYLKLELEKFMAQKEDFLKSFRQEDYDFLAERWERKIRMVGDAGDMKWGLYVAKKPL